MGALTSPPSLPPPFLPSPTPNNQLSPRSSLSLLFGRYLLVWNPLILLVAQVAFYVLGLTPHGHHHHIPPAAGPAQLQLS